MSPEIQQKNQRILGMLKKKTKHRTTGTNKIAKQLILNKSPILNQQNGEEIRIKHNGETIRKLKKIKNIR